MGFRPVLAGLFLCSLLVAAESESARWQHEARAVTIIRDDWGIAHVYGKTDADAVFGAIYAQAEDDFNRVEANFLTSLGRTAEAEGESKIFQDLRQRLFIDPVKLQQAYRESPVWLRKLMDAWADGLNFYLSKHPEIHAKVLTHWEPWMALSFSEGSIGGDIERVSLSGLTAFYGRTGEQAEDPRIEEPRGSNGIAIAPSDTRDHHALLLINPHTSFFFRSELQMVSDEGLRAYGAATWGQFFLYQGFNDKVGWMHTSSGVDAVDEYTETVEQRGGAWVYKHGAEWRPVTPEQIAISYKKPEGIRQRTFTVFRTEHGPVVRALDGKWVSFRIMQEPMKALEQSWLRTKARDYASYRKTMDLFANSSNNTVFASAQGDIAYFHGNYIPRRDRRIDWTRPVDGSDPATDYKGLLRVDEAPNLLNPKSGWLYNVNNWPWSAAGPYSLKRESYPAYVETGRFETARGLHALRVLNEQKNFTLESLLAAAFDSYLPYFEKTIPALLKAADAAQPKDLTDEITVLRAWDYRWGLDSVATSLAVFWGDELQRRFAGPAREVSLAVEDYAAQRAPGAELLDALRTASRRLTTDFGKWQTPWKEINRFQRLTDDIVPSFDDGKPSIPVAFTSSTWGSLASFGARAWPGTKRWYGTSGNSFVAVVEFGPRVRAVAVTAGGESGNPMSRHFNDQAERYATGNLREVYFYREQLTGHTEREYRPGEQYKKLTGRLTPIHSSDKFALTLGISTKPVRTAPI
jgi:acyl-homoserine lactone acylase PvdQ